ncbi:MAG: hypothetical protein HN769_12720 [Anaerolineae bacterium]|nr:hypothetical protein [Anaerolineae bacterium]
MECGGAGPYGSRSEEVKVASPDKETLRLESALPLKGWAIQVAGRGTARQARSKEAAALLIGALATVAESSGVSTLNTINSDGQPLALAIIENARFGEVDGETTLSPVIDIEKEIL